MTDDDFADLAEIRASLDASLEKKPTSKNKKKKKAARGTASPHPNLARLPRVLVEDPFDTLGVELHVGVTTCAHCGASYRFPLSGTNTLNRKVKRKTPRTPHERLVDGPFPWIATSEPQSEAELEQWKQENVTYWADTLGVETIEHHFYAVRCEACTAEAKIPKRSGQQRLRLMRQQS